MSFSGTWDETSPPGPEAMNLGDNRIRDFKRDIRERLAVDLYFLQSEGSDAKIGFHNKSTYVNQGSDPAQVANAIALYSKQTGSYSEIYSRHENAALQQLTLNGKLWIPGLTVASAVAGDIISFDGTTWGPLTFSGIVVMWKGTVATIPSGWLLCDGTNGTPDLRDKFIVGAKQDSGGAAKTNVSGSLTQTGGEATHVLTAAEMPSHTHTHATSPSFTGGGGGGAPVTGAGALVTGSAGSDAAHNILPPYYALCFIMKS